MMDKRVMPKCDSIGSPGPNRREMIATSVLLAGAITAPAAAVRRAPQAERLSDSHRRMLAAVSDIVIPPTDTLGAAGVNAGKFVELALSHGLDGTREPGSSVTITTGGAAPIHLVGLKLFGAVESLLDKAAGGDFIAASRATREHAVAAIDAAAFAPGGERHPWHKIKDLILTGYYTSEVGASQELAYELVPGEWDPNVPVSERPRAFSSDWTAVDFG